MLWLVRMLKWTVCCWALVSAAACCGKDTLEYRESRVLVARQWDVLDIRFTDVADERVDSEFEADFVHESGKTLSIPGFFDGARNWVLRFTPPLQGSWSFKTKSDLEELNGLAGRVQAKVATPGRKGGVVVEPAGKRRFVHENGDRYFPIAFECDWLFALDAENPDGIPVTRQFVDGLSEDGFNQIVMNVYAYDVNWEKDNALRPEHEYGSPRVFPFRGNNEDPDYSKLNYEYFRRLDRVIDYLDQKGIVAHLMVYVWNKRVNWPDGNSEADNRYFDHVARRYQAFPNLIWDISKEALGYGHTDVHYITERIERLRELDVYDRLITVHDYSYCKRFPEKVDFVSVQLWHSELYSVMRNVLKEIPNKPILNIEHGGYERSPYEVFHGNYTSPEVCLERAYQCVFAGTFPTHYWQGAAWNVIIADVDSLPSEDRPKFHYYRGLQTLVERFPVDEMIAGERKSNAGFSLHDNQGTYLFYVPKECEYIGLRLPKDLRGRQMQVSWFNPFTGEFSIPETREIPQWPSVQMQDGQGFRILIVKAPVD